MSPITTYPAHREIGGNSICYLSTWTSCHVNIGLTKHKQACSHTFTSTSTHMGMVELTNDLAFMSLDYKWKWWFPERTHQDDEKIYKLNTEGFTSGPSNPLTCFHLNCMSSEVKLAVSSFFLLVASCSIWHSCDDICPSDRYNTDTNI